MALKISVPLINTQRERVVLADGILTIALLMENLVSNAANQANKYNFKSITVICALNRFLGVNFKIESNNKSAEKQ